MAGVLCTRPAVPSGLLCIGASYEFMATVLFSWKKGVETSIMFMVMFMVVFDFFRAVRLFNFLNGLL